MAKRFPRTESDITKLAGRVVDGLTNAEEEFPAPPVSSEELRGKLDSFQAADTATAAAERWHPVAVAGRDPGIHHRLGGRRLGHPALEAPADGGSPAFYRIQRRQERILALERASKRWTRPVKDWWAALNHLSIVFEGRVPV
jgi:hypothetical protein